MLRDLWGRLLNKSEVNGRGLRANQATTSLGGNDDYIKVEALTAHCFLELLDFARLARMRPYARWLDPECARYSSSGRYLTDSPPTFGGRPVLTRRPAARRDYSEGNHGIGRRTRRRIDGSLEAAAQPISSRVFQGAADDKLVRTRPPRCVRSERPGAFADRQPGSSCHSTSAGVGDGQVARIPTIDRPVKVHDEGLQRLGPYRRHLPRRCDRAGFVRGSDPPPLDKMSIDRQGHVVSHREDRTHRRARLESALDTTGMHHERQYVAVGRPQLLLEKRLLDLSSVSAQQGDPGKQRTFDLIREPDGNAKQIGWDLGTRGLNKDDPRCRPLSVSTTQRDCKSGCAGPSTELHGPIPTS